MTAQIGSMIPKWTPPSAESIAKLRAELREKLLVNLLLDQGEVQETYEIHFDGSGDSGNVSEYSGNEEVDKLLEDVVNHYVTVDWYNNDGGYGTITWDIKTDVITIDVSQRETISHQAMLEEI